MRTEPEFDLDRFYLNFRYTAGVNYNSLITSFVLTVVIVMLVNILMGAASGNIYALYQSKYDILINLYYIFLYIIGFKIASTAFYEIKRKNEKIAYLLLPSSMPEKYLCRLIMTTLLFFIKYTVAFYLGWLLSSVVNFWLFGLPLVFFNIYVPNFWNIIAVFVVLQSLFFLGGIYFRKFPIIKTVASIFLISVVIVIIMFFSALFFKVTGAVMSGNLDVNYLTRSFIVIKYWYIGLFYAFIPIMCWLIGYFKFKETSIK